MEVTQITMVLGFWNYIFVIAACGYLNSIFNSLEPNDAHMRQWTVNIVSPDPHQAITWNIYNWLPILPPEIRIKMRLCSSTKILFKMFSANCRAYFGIRCVEWEV